MRTLKTPSGFLVEDRPEGLYLIGDVEAAEQLVADNAFIKTGFDGASFSVTIRQDENSVEVDEWGKADNLVDAMRYAYGAHLGSFDDPEATADEIAWELPEDISHKFDE